MGKWLRCCLLMHTFHYDHSSNTAQQCSITWSACACHHADAGWWLVACQLWGSAHTDRFSCLLAPGRSSLRDGGLILAAELQRCSTVSCEIAEIYNLHYAQILGCHDTTSILRRLTRQGHGPDVRQSSSFTDGRMRTCGIATHISLRCSVLIRRSVASLASEAWNMKCV